MEVGSSGLRQRLVRSIADQQMPEAIGVVTGELSSVGADELLAHESDKALVYRAVAIVERCNRPAVEGSSLHGTALEHRALRRVQLVEPCGQQCLDRRRH